MSKHEAKPARSECIDADTAVELLASSLSDAKADALREHIDDCDDCRTFLASVLIARRSDDEDVCTSEEPSLLPYPGSMIDRYQVIRLVGIGGMGMVYCAQDPKLDRLVALKLLRPVATVSPAASQTSRQDQLVRESTIMAGLQSSHIATIYDVGQWEGRTFVALEFAEDGTLQEWMRSETHSWSEIAEKFSAAGKGLAAAHSLGVVHGDFKPANVLLTRDGEVRVSDFGLAKYSNEGDGPAAVGAAMESRQIVGTPAYMAPEQYWGEEATERSDQFSFCASLYEVLYGARPERDESGGVVLSSVAAQSASAREAPSSVRRALVRGLATNANERYSSMDELLHALQGRSSISRWGYAAAAFACVAALALVWSATRSTAQAKTLTPAYEVFAEASKRFADTGQLAHAEHSAAQALQVAEKNSDLALQVETLLLQAQLTVSTGRGDRDQLLRRAAALAEESGDSDLRGQALARLSANGTSEGADVLLALAEGAAKATATSSESRQYLDLLGAAAAASAETEGALATNLDGFLESLALYQRPQGDGLQASSEDHCVPVQGLQEKGLCYLLRAAVEAMKEEYAASVASSNTALEYLEMVEGGDPCLVADALFMRGGANLYLDPPKAEKDFATILATCMDENGATNTLMWAISLAECGRFTDARRAIKKLDIGALDDGETEDLATLRDAIIRRVRPTTLDDSQP
tara:strand:- start:52146 stop:54242 length:2097 start_codon:yes stop_codon:yes gene_type:complete